jgi:hypothetical protein
MNREAERGAVVPEALIPLALLCCLLASIPFLIVKFPPLTDLPQHVAQVRLFGEAISHADSPYRIQWITPYSLVYSVLGASWLLFGAANAGRIGMLIITVLWIFMVFLLAYKAKRPALAAALAVILFFSHILYWGFYQFVFGWPLFIGWVLLLRTRFRSRWSEALVFFLGSLLLYMTHILWFAVGLGWLVLSHLLSRREPKTLLVRAAAASPFLVLAAVWYPSLASYGFQSQTIWATMPFQRLLPNWLADAALGGLRGSFESVFFGVIVVWILVAWLSNRRNISTLVDKELLWLAASLFALVLVLPDKYTNTIRFSSRWLPPALVFLLLALPRPRIRKDILTALVTPLLVAFFIITSLNWVAFERSDLSGLKESLAALPPAPRVLGLSYIKESSIVRGWPFIQVFAYAQVYRGGELNFSFADFGPSLVVYRERRRLAWTGALEWLPERARKADLLFFDYVLVNGDDRVHGSLIADRILMPLTQSGHWRLYKVSKEASRGSS